MTDNEDHGYCNDCVHHHKTGNISGECRKFAPRPVTEMDTTPDQIRWAEWPRVNDDDWCGEFQAKAAKQDATVDPADLDKLTAHLMIPKK